MTLEQLRIFVAVAERLHMTRAGETLNLTQSAVSASIAALETRYGAQLFDRVGRGLALSAVGATFLPEARAVLSRAAAAASSLDDLAGLKRGKVTLFASQTIASYWLPPRLARFAQTHPQVQLHLKMGNTAQAARAVAEGDAELGFVEGRVDDPSFDHRRVGWDRLAVVASAGHPLATQRDTSITDLLAADWVLREEGSGTRSEFERALGAAGVSPHDLNVRLSLPSNEAVLAAVASGLLLSAISELAAAPLMAAGHIRVLSFGLPERSFELLTSKQRHRSRAAAALLEAI